jgi:hypothetical protein
MPGKAIPSDTVGFVRRRLHSGLFKGDLIVEVLR